MRELKVEMYPRKVERQSSPGLAARKVLADCVKTHELLEDCPDSEPQLRRVYYVALVALLRAVGHVLDKVDGATGAGLATIIASEHKGSKELPIFAEFIDKERNNVLKNYNFAAEELVATGLIATHGGEPIDESFYVCDLLLIDEGFYDGWDFRDLALDAIEFWRCTLDRIELLHDQRMATESASR